ncbi:putative sulfate exporter family transporter [Sphingobium sp. AN558]|uniref:YeiH family protein n=1 Tax=Sphingobium sp. AN558 TaxID=3133442 RepID=UPI0030BD8288
MTLAMRPVQTTMITPKGDIASVTAADLYCELYEPDSSGAFSLRDYWPGLSVTAAAVLAASFLSGHYGAPLALMGLLIGLSLSFLNQDVRLRKGLGLASHTLLRVGIMLVGLRITASQIADLGPVALGAVAIITAATLVSGMIFARMLGFNTGFGTLAGGAVAICGASAAAALAVVLDTRRQNPAHLSIVLVGIAAVSAIGMSLYPMLGHVLNLNDQQAGFFLGASIHDVAQSLGAGYSYSERAGETATIVKLSRVALLMPVLAIVAYAVAKSAGERRMIGKVPWFLVGFLVLVIVNSTIAIPPVAGTALSSLASILIAAAITAAAISSPLASLLTTGLKPFMVIVGASLVALILSLAAAMLLF